MIKLVTLVDNRACTYNKSDFASKYGTFMRRFKKKLFYWIWIFKNTLHYI